MTKAARRKARKTTAIDPRHARAAMLDRLADLELQHGHPRAAEHLANRAAQLREGAR